MRFAKLLFDQYAEAELGDLPNPARLIGEHPTEFRT
jgi:hypothetical protein